ncbi:MAG: hypothetical protein M3R71_03945 [Actinomycetota bacterium]|nr:hypothetical protein [Actinomycetota bacterium]
MICGTTRVRISTTTDADRLVELRRLLGVNDSTLVDRAIAALLDALEAESEQLALDSMPYEADPDLSWAVPRGPDLPYAGEVPEDVQRLARDRRGE